MEIVDSPEEDDSDNSGDHRRDSRRGLSLLVVATKDGRKEITMRSGRYPTTVG